MTPSIFVGYDPRELNAYVVTRSSLLRHNSVIPTRGIVLEAMRDAGLYWRPTERDENGRLFDVISQHTMSTEFAISRFLTPILARGLRQPVGNRWSLFMDCDMLVRHSIFGIFHAAQPDKAVMVVKHNHVPDESVKMDDQVQSRYSRKNWSSVMLFNVDHPSNQKLTVELINEVPGRDLHAFCWLKDDEIGELDPKWNYLVGYTKGVQDPSIVHFTNGIPTIPGYENSEYAREWHDEAMRWIAGA